MTKILKSPPPYVRPWHAVHDWAREALEPGDVEEFVDPWGNKRVAGWRAKVVRDLRDPEEALERATPIENGFPIPMGPLMTVGGRRRVVIRAHTWVWEGGYPYDPEWITLGQGLTAASAVAHAHRWWRSYSGLVARGLESKRLYVTAWEIVFWTANPTADYV